MNEKIIELQRQIEAEQQKINSCNHVFGETYRDDRKTKEAYGYRMEGQGSDVWPVPEGYRDVFVKRWARKCEKCGKVEHTENLEVIEVIKKPKF